jgi:hypothetical protein
MISMTQDVDSCNFQEPGAVSEQQKCRKLGWAVPAKT